MTLENPIGEAAALFGRFAGRVIRGVHGPPKKSLRQAQEAAGGLDVRIGIGPSTVIEFLQAYLIDFLQVVIVVIVLGAGVRNGDHIAGLASSLGLVPARTSTTAAVPTAAAQRNPPQLATMKATAITTAAIDKVHGTSLRAPCPLVLPPWWPLILARSHAA